MNKKHILPLILGSALLILLGVFLLITLTRPATTPTVIDADTTPAILARAGQPVNLPDYAIRLNGTLYEAGDIRWTLKDAQVTSLVPEESNITALKAVFGGQEKTIYVLTQEPDETAFVLYQSDFEEGGKAMLRRDGWVFPDNSSATVSDGQLLLGGQNENYARAILPPYIGEFAGYRIELTASMINARDTERWCSIAYHIENETGGYYPYYHMCVRNQTLKNTVEFTERNAEDEWNLIQAFSWGVDLKSAPHQISVSCYGGTVLYEIDGEAIFYTENASDHIKGLAGLIANYGTLCADSIRVTLLTEAPVEPLRTAKLIDTSVNRREMNVKNYVSCQSYATAETIGNILSGERFPVGLIYDPQEEELSETRMVSILADCMRRGIIPGFFLTSEKEADRLNEAARSLNAPEVLVAGDARTVCCARNLNPSLMRGVLVCGTAPENASALYREAAEALAQGVLLSARDATKEYVSELQKYGLSVWAMQTDPLSDTACAHLIASGANCVVTSDFEEIDRAIEELFTGENALTRTPVWAAHRGDHQDCPENSLSAFRSAAQKGADCVELDVQMTSDSEIVISHDTAIGRVSDGSGNIPDMTLDELRRFKLKNPDGTLSDESFPTLSEVLDAMKDTDVMILCELKGSNPLSVQKTAQIVKDAGMEERVIFISFTGSQLTALKEQLPAVTGLLASAPENGTPNTPATVLNRYYESQDACLQYHSTLSLSYDRIGPEFLRDACDRGMTLWTWTYTNSTAGQVCSNFLYGMNAMTTDHISYLRDTAKALLPSVPAIRLNAGEDAQINLYALNYAKELQDVTANVSFRILDREGVFSYENGTVRALSAGSASLIFSFESALPNGTVFTLYSQPVTITVNA